MSVTLLRRPAPASVPVALPPVAPTFPPSEELGEQLRHLHRAQVEVDRRRLEELARLREIQNRD